MPFWLAPISPGDLDYEGLSRIPRSGEGLDLLLLLYSLRDMDNGDCRPAQAWKMGKRCT